MYLWIIAIVLLIALGLIGFYQGALKVAFSLVGLLLGALLAKPVGMVFDLILPALGLSHPAILAFVSPLLGFIVILAAFKIGAFALHRKIDTWYKYKGSDTERLLWERLNARVGIALGVVNAYVYLLLLTTLISTIGYFTYQMSTDRNESWIINTVNRVAKDVETTGMIKSVAPFTPVTDTYFDSCDVLADLFHTPLLQNRLANYPLFLTLNERPEFTAIADSKFQEQWATGMSLREFAGHEAVKPLLENQELYTNVLAMVKPDLKDLKAYLESGNSAKYDEEKILGKWQFNARASIAEVRRRKPTIGSAELKNLRIRNAIFANSLLIATVDNGAILKLPALAGKGPTRGNWKSAGGGQYQINMSEGDQKLNVQAFVDGKKMICVRDGLVLVFENTRV
jgi:hypothetical protein